MRCTSSSFLDVPGPQRSSEKQARVHLETLSPCECHEYLLRVTDFTALCNCVIVTISIWTGRRFAPPRPPPASVGCIRQLVALQPQPNVVTQVSPSAKLRDLCGRARLPSMGGIGLNIPRKSHRRGHEGTQSLNWSSITVSPIPDAGWRNLVPSSDESGKNAPLGCGLRGLPILDELKNVRPTNSRMLLARFPNPFLATPLLTNTHTIRPIRRSCLESHHATLLSLSA